MGDELSCCVVFAGEHTTTRPKPRTFSLGATRGLRQHNRAYSLTDIWELHMNDGIDHDDWSDYSELRRNLTRGGVEKRAHGAMEISSPSRSKKGKDRRAR